MFDVPINAHQWKNSVSFFMHDTTSAQVGCYSDEPIYCVLLSQLCLKIKRQGLLSNTKLAVHILDLNTLGLLGQQNHNSEEQAMKWYDEH